MLININEDEMHYLASLLLEEQRSIESAIRTLDARESPVMHAKCKKDFVTVTELLENIFKVNFCQLTHEVEIQ